MSEYLSPSINTEPGPLQTEPNPGIEPTPKTPSDEAINQRPWLNPLIGSIVLAAILLAAPIYGRLTAGDKISPDIDRDAAQQNIIVDLPFVPEAYHRETLSELGVFAGRDREDPTKIRLRAVAPEGLDTIANFFWVEGIEPS